MPVHSKRRLAQPTAEVQHAPSPEIKFIKLAHLPAHYHRVRHVSNEELANVATVLDFDNDN